MNVYDLDNKLVKWNPTGFSSSDNRVKSSLHQCAKRLLHEKYPTLHILEEVSIPIRRRQSAYFDFYLPLPRKAYEVHGEQHFKFVPHFHINIQGFIAQKKRDAAKEEWCEKNNIELIILSFNNLQEWKELL